MIYASSFWHFRVPHSYLPEVPHEWVGRVRHEWVPLSTHAWGTSRGGIDSEYLGIGVSVRYPIKARFGRMIPELRGSDRSNEGR